MVSLEPDETCRGEDSESQSQFLVEVVLHAAGEPREASAETPIWHRFFLDVMDGFVKHQADISNPFMPSAPSQKLKA